LCGEALGEDSNIIIIIMPAKENSYVSNRFMGHSWLCADGPYIEGEKAWSIT